MASLQQPLNDGEDIPGDGGAIAVGVDTDPVGRGGLTEVAVAHARQQRQVASRSAVFRRAETSGPISSRTVTSGCGRCLWISCSHFPSRP